MDLVVAVAAGGDGGTQFNEGFAYVLLGRGDGTFAQPVQYQVLPGSWQVVVGDFTRDGLLDIATANRSVPCSADERCRAGRLRHGLDPARQRRRHLQHRIFVRAWRRPQALGQPVSCFRPISQRRGCERRPDARSRRFGRCDPDEPRGQRQGGSGSRRCALGTRRISTTEDTEDTEEESCSTQD
jgi:hypothetical protein